MGRCGRYDLCTCAERLIIHPAQPAEPEARQSILGISMTESEISALLDAHDSLVRAYVDSRLTFSEFFCTYGDFPHNYALVGGSGSAAQRVVLQLFRQRMTFHLRV